MALQDVPGILLPQQLGLVAYTGVTLSASGSKVAFMFRAPKTGTIDRVFFKTTTLTTPTDTDIRLETVDATTGDPTGTLFATNSNIVIASGSMTANAFIEATLTAGAPVTKGDILAVVIAPSGTPNMTFSRLAVPTGFGQPYSASYAGSWTKSINAFPGAIRYSDGSYPHTPGVWPVSALSTVGITSTGTPDEIGNLINLPFKCRASGLLIDTNSGGAGSTIVARIYDAADAVLASKTLTMTQLSGAGIVMATLDAAVTLEAATDYRIAVEATTTTNRTFKYVDAPNSSVAEALPLGNKLTYTARTNAGAWSQTANRRLGIGLIVDQLDDGAGGGARAYGFAG